MENRNFEIRKYVLEYDDVMNQRREIIYAKRKQILLGENLRENILAMIEKIAEHGIALYADANTYPEDWDLAGLIKYCEEYFAAEGRLTVAKLETCNREEGLREEVLAAARKPMKAGNGFWRRKHARTGKVIMLKVLDSKWIEHCSYYLTQILGSDIAGGKDARCTCHAIFSSNDIAAFIHLHKIFELSTSRHDSYCNKHSIHRNFLFLIRFYISYFQLNPLCPLPSLDTGTLSHTSSTLWQANKLS